MAAPFKNIQALLTLATQAGALASLGKGIPVLQVRKRFTIAEVNAGANIVAAVGVGFKYRMVNYKMIAIGGAGGGATDVRILGTRGGGSVALAVVAIAALTQSALNQPGTANNTLLADGASFTQLDENTAITIGKTGGALTTATHVDVVFEYAADET